MSHHQNLMHFRHRIASRLLGNGFPLFNCGHPVMFRFLTLGTFMRLTFSTFTLRFFSIGFDSFAIGGLAFENLLDLQQHLFFPR